MKIADLHQDLYCYWKYPELSGHEFKVVDLAVAAIWPYKFKNEKVTPLAYKELLKEVKDFKAWLESKGYKIVLDKEDLYDEKPKIILALEGIEFYDVVDLYDEGVKVVGPWRSSKIGGDKQEKYLEESDKKFVRSLSKKFVIDLAHASYELKYFCLKEKIRCILSHVGVKKFCIHSQNIGDMEIDLIKKVKGLIGLSFLKHHTNFEYRKHFEWLVEKLGTNYLAIGSDWYGFKKEDGIDWKYIEENFTRDEVETLYENVIRFFEKNL